MGVGGVRTRLKTESSDLVRKVPLGTTERFDAVAVEVNPLLYEAAGCKDDPKEICDYAINFLNDLLCNIAGNNASILIVIDGQPPLAKLPLQRERRQKYVDLDTSSFSRINFTPGTSFMSKFRRQLTSWANTFSETRNPSTCEICGDNIAGEGELKITRWLGTLDSKKTCIVGTDGDLILTMLAHPVLNCCVYDPFAQTVSSTGTVLKEWNLPSFAGFDFCSLQLLIGSDILPGIPNFDAANTWTAYKKKSKQLWHPHPTKQTLLLNYGVLSSILRCNPSGKKRLPGNKNAKGYIEAWAWAMQMTLFGHYNYSFIPKSTIDVKGLIQYCKGKGVEEVTPPVVDGRMPCMQATLASVIPRDSWKAYLQPAVFACLKKEDVDENDCLAIHNLIPSANSIQAPLYQPVGLDRCTVVQCDHIHYTKMFNFGLDWVLDLPAVATSPTEDNNPQKDVSFYRNILIISSIIILVAASTTVIADELRHQ